MPRAKPSADPKVRTLGAQLETLPSNKLLAIVDSVFSGGSSSNSTSSSSTLVAPATPKRSTAPAATNKRKQTVDSPDASPIQETPSPKKKRSTATPVVDSPVIRALENMMTTTQSTPVRSLRPRVKTEKALAMEASKSSSKRVTGAPSASSGQPSSLSKVAPLGSPLELTESEDELPPAPRFISPVEAQTAVNKVSDFVDDEAVEDNVDPDVISISSGHSSGDEIDDEMKDFIVPDSEVLLESDISNASIVAERGSVARDLSEQPLDDCPDTDGELDIEVSPEIIAFVSVMNPDIQEDMMKATYEGLPPLDRVFHTRPYHYDASKDDNDMFYPSIEDTANSMSEANAQSFVRCLLFEEYGCYVNAARIDPQHVVDYQKRLCIRQGEVGSHCVLITTGVVSASHLFKSSVTTGGLSTYEQHRLTICKFEQEAQRENALIGQTFNMYSGVYSTISNTGFAYVTRGSNKIEDSSYSSKYGGSGPPKNHGNYKRVTLPVTPVMRPVTSRKPFTEYNEIVPVLDGRAETGEPFRFCPEDFNRLNSWRMYGKCQTELPEGAVVAIGYGASHFEHQDTGNRYLTLNIFFVILLHLPQRVVALAPLDDKGKGKAKAKPAPKAKVTAKGKGKAKALDNVD